MAKDYYDILGVSKSATDSEIKRGYRKMANKFHPDKNQGDSAAEEKFKDVSKAYETLSDPQKRRMYDQFGEQGANMGGGAGGFGQGFGGFDFSGGGGGADAFADIFETFFGGGGQRRGGNQKRGPRQTPGEDLEMRLELNFDEAIFGTQKKIKIRRLMRSLKA